MLLLFVEGFTITLANVSSSGGLETTERSKMTASNGYLERRVDRKRLSVRFLRGFRLPKLPPTQSHHVPIGFGVDARLDHLAKV